MKNDLQILSEIADVFYDPDYSYGGLYQACQQYKQLLLKVTEISLTDADFKDDIYTDSGRAIGTAWAIRCIEEIMRTYKFSSGLYNAAKEVLEQQEGPVRVLYAGTGPFAALALPLITRFTPEELQFDLLEINPDSAKFLKKVLEHFNAEDYVYQFEVTDAAKHKLKDPEGINIFLSETMQMALANEPQVAIAYNLFPQLQPQAIMIPKEISLHLIAINDDKWSEYKTSLKPGKAEYYEDLGLLFALNKNEIKEHHTQMSSMADNAEFDPVIIELPRGINKKYNHLMIGTRITVYDQASAIDFDECSLTCFKKLHELNPMMQTVKALKASYLMGEYPGLDFEMNP